MYSEGRCAGTRLPGRRSALYVPLQPALDVGHDAGMLDIVVRLMEAAGVLDALLILQRHILEEAQAVGRAQRRSASPCTINKGTRNSAACA